MRGEFHNLFLGAPKDVRHIATELIRYNVPPLVVFTSQLGNKVRMICSHVGALSWIILKVIELHAIYQTPLILHDGAVEPFDRPRNSLRVCYNCSLVQLRLLISSNDWPETHAVKLTPFRHWRIGQIKNRRHDVYVRRQFIAYLPTFVFVVAGNGSGTKDGRGAMNQERNTMTSFIFPPLHTSHTCIVVARAFGDMPILVELRNTTSTPVVTHENEDCIICHTHLV
mmetsp:Transcript_26373/g.61682  ORF Transcript_26373/g.61682 Transcript_26373/m.61682 type:complete len:226 (+) Transcript_26373:460-1137(+)